MTPRSPETGAALLTVLLLVAVMAVLAIAALDRIKLATHLAANTAATEQARAYAFAAESVARYRIGDLIQRDPARTTLDSDWARRPTNFPIDGGLATARLDDGGNCFNLNALVDAGAGGALIPRPVAIAQFARLLALLEVSGRDAQTIAAAAADWIDSDTTPLPGGAEDAAYTGAAQPMRTANTLMADISELRVVAGVSPAIYQRARPYLCALPVAEPSAININTLRPDQAVLLSMLLPSVDPARAAAAIALRPAQGGFASLAAFFALPPMAGPPGVNDARGQVAMKTRWFDVALTVELPDAEFEEHALIDAGAKPAKLARRSYGEPT